MGIVRRTPRGRRIGAISMVSLLTLGAAACSSSKTPSASSQTPPTAGVKPPTSIGAGEGQLNLIAWEGYTQPQWVKPFEKQTGCQVHAKYAGSSGEMVSLMANGGGGQYDMVSASGDADLRLIYGGDVKPVNVSLVQGWKQFRPFLKAPDFNTIDGIHYGTSLQFGPNVLLVLDQDLPNGAHILERHLRPQVQRSGHGAEQPDPDRGRRAVPREDEAEPRDH